MAQHVYHWKHGWIPLTHEAALKKAHGSHTGAAKLLAATEGHDTGIRSRRDVAHAALDLPNVPANERSAPRAEVVAAAHRLGASDILPTNMQHEDHVVLYHGTAAHNVENIRKNGIDTKHSAGWFTLTDSRHQAAYYANHDGAVIEFHVPKSQVHTRGNKDSIIWQGAEHSTGGVTATAHAVKTNLPGSMIHKVHKASDVRPHENVPEPQVEQRTPAEIHAAQVAVQKANLQRLLAEHKAKNPGHTSKGAVRLSTENTPTKAELADSQTLYGNGKEFYIQMRGEGKSHAVAMRMAADKYGRKPR